MSYVRRRINVTFSGGGQVGSFSGGGTGGTLTFDTQGKYALRTTARITHAGGLNFGEMSLEIRGLSLQHINQLSTFGRYYQPDSSYRIQVDAGDDENGMSTVFTGSIRQAWGDMRAMPDVPFRVLAYANMGSSGDQGNVSSKVINPTSFSGPTQVTQMLQQICQQCGVQFENNGVNTKLTNPYYWGSPWKQISEIIKHAGVYGAIDNGVLAVWPKGGSRGSSGGLVISPQTGLRDYPAFTEYGVQVRVEFKRAVQFGSNMTIQGSSIAPANGVWQIIRIDYDLQANTPKGSWFMILDGSKLGAPVTML
jgi:hypothetical protein